MRTSTTRTRRGFTLLELAIAMGVSSMVVLAALTLLMSQQRAYQAGTEDRSLQDTGRVALSAVMGPLRTAGYGIDPAFALDLGDTEPVWIMKRGNRELIGALRSYACDAPILCRDHVDAPDELVFYARDPTFRRPVVAATAASVRLRGQMAQTLRRGQVLQLMCNTEPFLRAYVTVGATVGPVIPPDPDAEYDVQLEAGVQIGGRDAFPNQNAILTTPCFSTGDAIAAKVDRFRFHVVSFLPDGTVFDPRVDGGDAVQTAYSRPYLMLDQGLFDENDELIDRPVAPDVEDLQVTYLYRPAVPNGALQEVGAAEGFTADADAFPMQLVAPPRITDPPTAPSRATGSPVNIQAIRVSLVVRSPDENIKYASEDDRRIPPQRVTDDPNDPAPLANRPAYLGLTNYKRTRFDATAQMPNLRNAFVMYCNAAVSPGGC